MAYAYHVPWYATGLRGDRLEAALRDVTPTAVRYGATGWLLYRSQDDRYKLLQIIYVDDKLDFQRWWEGPEMTEMRTITSGWWQVPLLYVPHDILGSGWVEPVENGDDDESLEPEPSDAEPATSS